MSFMALKSRHVSVDHTKENRGKISNPVRGRCRNTELLSSSQSLHKKSNQRDQCEYVEVDTW